MTQQCVGWLIPLTVSRESNIEVRKKEYRCKELSAIEIWIEKNDADTRQGVSEGNKSQKVRGKGRERERDADHHSQIPSTKYPFTCFFYSNLFGPSLLHCSEQMNHFIVSQGGCEKNEK